MLNVGIIFYLLFFETPRIRPCPLCCWCQCRCGFVHLCQCWFCQCRCCQCRYISLLSVSVLLSVRVSVVSVGINVGVVSVVDVSVGIYLSRWCHCQGYVVVGIRSWNQLLELLCWLLLSEFVVGFSCRNQLKGLTLVCFCWGKFLACCLGFYRSLSLFLSACQNRFLESASVSKLDL